MLLLLKNVTKTFYGVKVLDDIRFELKAGEVHALIGENGAGKSTLAHLIAGVHQPDSGTIMLEDREVSIGSPYYAKKTGHRNRAPGTSAIA
ncbi:ATP-binding cassette domain-containing protein [Cohnella rhizosphaerae]|uniref:ATP-binding cassette domain-containing protein n=1 Tax=Cohnella rhizosphaerae TaxID=1457232 RepID=UPI002406E006|nr:ATP-binding cassette domain-containing protein [Cohnella rhizosphaerae]